MEVPQKSQHYASVVLNLLMADWRLHSLEHQSPGSIPSNTVFGLSSSRGGMIPNLLGLQHVAPVDHFATINWVRANNRPLQLRDT